MALRLLAKKFTSITLISNKVNGNGICTNSVSCKAEDRRQMKASMPAKDMGTIGERTADIDSILSKYAKY